VKVAPTVLSVTLRFVLVSPMFEMVPAPVEPISVNAVTPLTLVALNVFAAASKVTFTFSTFFISPGVTDVATEALNVSVPAPPSISSRELSVFPPEEVKPAFILLTPAVPSISSTPDVRE